MADDNDCPIWCAGYDRPEYILCAANHYNDGAKYVHQPRNIDIGFVVCGRRHHNCIMTYAMTRSHTGLDRIPPCIQGFLTSKDRFLDRHEAYALAVVCGQLKHESRSDKPILMSEDLY